MTYSRVIINHSTNGDWGNSLMTRDRGQPDPQFPMAAPRPWHSGAEFSEEAELFREAAHRFIGRGEDEKYWSPAQRLRMKLALIIESADYSEDWQKTMHQMVRAAHAAVGGERRRLAVQAIEAWGTSWKHSQWQATTETRRACLSHLVSALEAFDSVFSQLRYDLDSLAEKLDAYARLPSAGEKSAERILAELVVEGADALGFAVEPHEPMLAEVLRIERQLEQDDAGSLPPAPPRTSRILQKAARAIEKAKKLSVSAGARRDRAR